MRARRTRELPAPPRRSSRLYVRLSPRDVARLKFLLEGYDHLAILTPVDRWAAELQVIYSPHQEAEVREFLNAAARHMTLTVIEPPGRPAGSS